MHSLSLTIPKICPYYKQLSRDEPISHKNSKHFVSLCFVHEHTKIMIKIVFQFHLHYLWHTFPISCCINCMFGAPAITPWIKTTCRRKEFLFNICNYFLLRNPQTVKTGSLLSDSLVCMLELHDNEKWQWKRSIIFSSYSLKPNLLQSKISPIHRIKKALALCFALLSEYWMQNTIALIQSSSINKCVTNVFIACFEVNILTYGSTHA